MSVIFNDGLEEIGAGAFYIVHVPWMHYISPPPIRAFKAWAFDDCLGLTTVILNNGLEEIEWGAFDGCMPLVRIVIPSAVRAI
jgi:hypothetical protein